MYILVLGIIIFFGIHLVPSIVGFRRKLISWLGEGGYKGLYSVIALTGLVLIVYGKSQAEYQVIWEPPLWSKSVVFNIMIVAFYFLVAADMKSNIKRFVRHPMLLGIMLWSGAHLFANGDIASMILFGSFFIFSLFDIFSANVRGATTQEKIYPVKKDIIILVASFIFYIIFIQYLHPYLIGVPLT